MNTRKSVSTFFALIAATFPIFLAAPLRATDIRPGLYKGTVVFTQTLTESGAIVKKTFPVSGRIRGNNSFIFISQPFGMATNQLDGRFFSGTLNSITKAINFITGTDVDGTTFTGNNLPSTYSANTLKLDWSYNLNLGQIPGDSINRRVFVLKRIGN